MSTWAFEGGFWVYAISTKIMYAGPYVIEDVSYRGSMTALYEFSEEVTVRQIG